MKPHVRRPRLLAVATALAATISAFAQVPDRKDRAVAEVPIITNPVPGSPAGLAWTSFQQQVGGQWSSRWCPATGTPQEVVGSGLLLPGWSGDSLAAAREHAERLFLTYGNLLGIGDSWHREIIGERMGETWVLVYEQQYRGLPVIGGRLDVRVHRSGRIPMFGSMLWPIPAGFDIQPRVDELEATRLAWVALGRTADAVAQPGRPRLPRLVIWGDIHARQRVAVSLAWEIPVSAVDATGDGPIGRYYIDARTGAVLHFVDDKVAFAKGADRDPITRRAPPPVRTTVTVRGWTRVGQDAASPLVNVPLRGVEVAVPGQGIAVTDANGQFSIDIASPVTLSIGALDGRRHGPILGSDRPSASVLVQPGVAATLQLASATATPNQAAHTTTAYWTDRVNEFCRSILGNSPQLAIADAILPSVNDSRGTCNAYYTLNTMNFYQGGGGCNNLAFSTVIAHEWGHGLDDRYGGISQVQGLSEGWGDIVAMYLVDNPIVGSGFLSSGGALRSGNNNTLYPPPPEVHDAGEVWMGFAWLLRGRLAASLGSRPAAVALTNRIVLGSIVANAIDQPAAVTQVFIADDDDGNLGNGTPHSADLIWACGQKRLPYPGMPRPGNDECGGAVAVVNGWNGPFDSSSASTSAPAWPCGNGGADLWFSFVATHSGPLQVSTCGAADWDTQIEILGGNCGGFGSLACNDDDCGLQSTVQANVTPGTWFIRVGGYGGAAGPFHLNVAGPDGISATALVGGLSGCYAQQLNAIQRNVPLGVQSSVSFAGNRVSVRFLDGTARNATGFQLHLSSNLPGSNVRNAYLYDATGTSNRPGNRLLTGKIAIGNGMRLCRASFDGSYRVQGSTLYYMSFDLLPGETVRIGTTTGGGASSVTVWNSSTFTNAPIVYGVNTDGRHAAISSTLPWIGRTATIRCREGEPGGWAVLHMGSSLLNPTFDPWYHWNRGPGSFLFVSPEAVLGIIGLDGSGNGDLGLEVVNSPVLAGLHCFAQWQISTPANGFGFSNYVDLGFGY